MLSSNNSNNPEPELEEDQNMISATQTLQGDAAPLQHWFEAVQALVGDSDFSWIVDRRGAEENTLELEHLASGSKITARVFTENPAADLIEIDGLKIRPGFSTAKLWITLDGETYPLGGASDNDQFIAELNRRAEAALAL